MTTVNKFLGAVCLPTDRGLCLPFRRKKSIEQIWVPEKSLGKIQTNFHQPFIFPTTSSLFSQGAGRNACSYSPSGFYFGVFGVACESRETQSDLELLVGHVVNPAVVCTALPWPGATGTHSATHPHSCGLGLCCWPGAVHSQNIAATSNPSRKSCL